MEEGDIHRQRRNLIIASLVLIIYNFGHGTFKGDLPSGIASVGFKLERPEILFWFMHAVVLYFWWRYWQYAKPHAHQFRNSYLARLRNQPAMLPLLRSHLPEERVKELASRQFDPQKKGGYHEPDANTLTITRRGWRFASVTFQTNLRLTADPNTIQGYEELEESVPAFKLYRMEVPSLILAVAKDVPFSEHYLPYAFPIVAIGTTIWRCWHG